MAPPPSRRLALALAAAGLTVAPPTPARAYGTGPAGARAADAAPQAPTVETSADLARAIDAALDAKFLADAHVGVHVVDLADGRTLYARNHRAAFNPASNVKLFTTYAALVLLGPAHRYVTEVYAKAPPTADGVVDGPLYVRGTGDPSLTTADLYELAGRLRARGVAKVRGPIVVDASSFAADRLPPGFDQKDEFASYRPKVGAFSVNFNTFVVRVTAGDEPGRPAAVRIDPPVPSIVVDRADVRTTEGWKRAVSVTHTQDRGRIHLVVDGTIGVSAPPLSYRFPVADPTRYAGEVFALVLRQRGVRLGRRRIERGEVPRRATRLGAHRSRTVAQLVRDVNKHSNNFMAEQILYGLDDARPATFDGALARVRALFEARGFGEGDLRLGNGSGLYDTNRTTPRAVVELLGRIHADFRVAPDFEASLPIVGLDGTTRRRLRDTPAAGWIRAKTGTLDGVSALSGYAGAPGRPPIAFSILFNDLGRWETNAARKVQDRIAAAVAAYAAATARDRGTPREGGPPAGQ